MTIDFATHLGAVSRSVSALERDGKPARRVTLERSYDTTADDLWDAVTNPERLPRWFAPVGGELKLGGRFHVEGNASGTITECVPPRSIAATWEFGGGMSWIELRLAPAGDGRSRLTLSHIAPVDDHWRKFGPGATGVGWDLGLLGLAMHLADPAGDRSAGEAFMASAGGKAFVTGASDDWRRAAAASGEDPGWADAAARATTAFYTGEAA